MKRLRDVLTYALPLAPAVVFVIAFIACYRHRPIKTSVALLAILQTISDVLP